MFFRKKDPNFFALAAATETYFAFRGRLMILLVLKHCGVSPRPLLPPESTYISSAIPVNLVTYGITFNDVLTLFHIEKREGEVVATSPSRNAQGC